MSSNVNFASTSLSLLALGVWLVLAPHTAAQSFFSVNALAYADVNLSTGSNYITNPFSRPNNAVSNLFPSMPNGTHLRIWDTTIQDFGPTNVFSSASGWSIPSATLISPQAALLRVPSSTPITFSGELMQGGLTGRTHFAGVYILGAMPRTGFVLCGNFDECGPAQPPSGTDFCKWFPPQQQYVCYTFITPQPGYPTGWADNFGNPADPRLEVGEAGLFSVPSMFSVPAVPVGTDIPTTPLVNARRVGTDFTFQFAVTNATTYSVQRSTNLNEGFWQTVQNGSATNSLATVTLTNMTHGVGFYRVRPQTFGLHLVNAARTNGQFSFGFTAPTNAVYEVQRTIAINPASWQTIGSFTTNLGSAVSFKDPNAVAASGYYRVRFTP